MADIAIFLLIFVAPWWFPLALVFAGIFLFNHFYESLLFGLLLDGFHGIPGIAFFGLNAFFTLTLGVIFISSVFLKSRIMFYRAGI